MLHAKKIKMLNHSKNIIYYSQHLTNTLYVATSDYLWLQYRIMQMTAV